MVDLALEGAVVDLALESGVVDLLLEGTANIGGQPPAQPSDEALVMLEPP